MRPFCFCTIAILFWLTCSKSKCDAFACAILVCPIYFLYQCLHTAFNGVSRETICEKSLKPPVFAPLGCYLAFFGLSCSPSSWLILFALLLVYLACPTLDFSCSHSPLPPLGLARHKLHQECAATLKAHRTVTFCGE